MNRKMLHRKRGYSESIIVIGLIVLSAIIMVGVFGKKEKSQYAGMTKALSGEDAVVDDEAADEAEEEMQNDPAIDQYRVAPGSGGGSQSTGSSASNPTPPVPDPVPLGSDNVRHHLGDGRYSGNAGGGNLQNEGLFYENNLGRVDNASSLIDEGYQFAIIKLKVDGVSGYTDPVGINGRVIGKLVNGENTFKVPISWFSNPNRENKLQIASTWSSNLPQTLPPPAVPNYGGRTAECDDFEFWDLSVTWSKT